MSPDIDLIRITTENADDYAVSMILQKGVFMDLPWVATVASFACRVLDLDVLTFNQEVQTLILNNRVVDEPNVTVLTAGDVLVLSGALPGLVGAMLRSDSPIKVLREQITGGSTHSKTTSTKPLILVKFFNTILKNHRDDILRYGFYIPDMTHE